MTLTVRPEPVEGLHPTHKIAIRPEPVEGPHRL
jgi:hypothetical protein